MGTRSSDDPKLLITPPFFKSNTGPPHFKNGQHAEGDCDDEEVNQEGEVQGLDDELAGKERESREEAVH